MKYIVIILPIVLFSCSPRFANIKIYENPTGQGYGPCEPSIVVNPARPDWVLAGTVLDEVHRSTDGGHPWQTPKLTSPLGVFGDPALTADYAGNFHYLHLGDPVGEGRRNTRWLESIVSQTSSDGGITWSQGAAIGTNPPKQQDKEWPCVDPRNNHLYVTWTEFDKYGLNDPGCHSRIRFSKSTDMGKTWSSPITLSQLEGNCLDGDQTTEGAVPAVGPEGEIYVTWSYDNKIFFDRSFDGGQTWLETDPVAAPHPGGWDFEIPGLGRCNGMPITGADLSNGKYRGSVYINWAQQASDGGDTDIMLAYSRDKGLTWSKPIKVNGDKGQKQQFLTWMSVDPVTGNIYMVYYDRRRFEDTQTDVILAVSRNGGASFREYRLNKEAFTPPGDKIFFGDYNNISAYRGRVRPIWTAYYNDRLSVWTALIDFKK